MKTITKTPRSRLALETLEERCNPSSVVANGDLYIYGTKANDNIQVTQYLTISGVGNYRVTDNGVTSYYSASRVWGGDVYLYGYAGNDYLDADAGLRVTAYGGAGNDTILGSNLNDYLDGGLGSDSMWGYSGNDKLMAGYDYSVNKLYGGAGNDALIGGHGVDVLHGEAGNDYLSSGSGNDFLFGGAGDDMLIGDAGDDRLYGGTGKDKLYGGADNDVLDGGAGFAGQPREDFEADYLNGGSGRDYFQRDMVWIGRWSVNRDAAADFTSGVDSYFG